MTAKPIKNARLVVFGFGAFLASCGESGGQLQTPANPQVTSSTDGVVNTDAGVPEQSVPQSVAAKIDESFGFETAEIEIAGLTGSPTLLSVYIADTTEKQQRGLMEVTNLDGRDGMLFVFDESRTGGFFMRNTPTPLTIVYWDDDGNVVDILDMDPCPDEEGCPTYPPSGEYRFALEVFQPTLDLLAISTESTLLTDSLP